MADETKKIVLQIELSADQAAERLVDLKKKQADLTDEQRKYKKELEGLKSGTVEYDNIQKSLVKLEAEQKALSAEARIYQRIIQGSIASQNQQEGSIEQLKASLSSLTAQYNLLSKEEQQNIELGGRLQAEIRQTSDELKKQESALGNNTRNVGNYQSALDGVGNKFLDVAKAAGLALSVDAVLNFASESVKAFQESELNARKLQTAISVNGGLQEDYNNLINQSKELQQTTIFSDDEIQQAQLAASQYGLTAQEIQKLIPVITDFASATGKGLSESLDIVIKGVEGSGKGLKEYGITVDQTQTRVERLASITDDINKKFQGQAQIVGDTAVGAMKKYENQVDDLKESLGERFLPVIQTLKLGLLSFVNDVGTVFSGDIFKGSDPSKEFEARYQFVKKYAAGLDDATLATKRVTAANDVLALTKQLVGVEKDSKEWDTLTKAINLSKAQLQAYTDTQKSRQGVDSAAKNEEDLTKLTIEEINKRIAAEKQNNGPGAQDKIDALTKELENRSKQSDALKKITEKDVENVKQALENLTTLYKENHQKILEELASAQEEKRALEKQGEIDEVNAEFEKTDKLAEARDIRNKLLADIDVKYKQLATDDSQKEFDEAIKQAEAAAAEIDRIAKQNALERKKDKADVASFVDSANEDSFQKELDGLYKQRDELLSRTTITEEERTKVLETYTKKRLDIEQLQQDSAYNATKNTLQNAANLFSKQTAAYKLLASASAIIDTYQAANAAYKSTAVIPYVGPVLAPIAAGVAVAAGLLNVAKINSVSIPSGASFYEGGYTGSGNPRDESRALGSKPYTYHKDEYVVPSKVLNNPAAAPLVNQLESFRRNLYNDSGPGARMILGRAYAETGGLVPGFNPLEGRVVTSISSISPDDIRAIVRETVSNMPNPVVAVRDINSEQADVAVGDARAVW